MFSGNQQGERRPLMEQSLGSIIAELESFFSGKTYRPTGDEDLLSAWGHINNVFTYPDEKRFVKAQIRAGQYHLANYCERYGITAMTSLPKAKAIAVTV